MSTWVACGDCGTTGQDRYGVGVCRHCGGKGIVEMVEVEGREMSVPVEKQLLPNLYACINGDSPLRPLAKLEAARLELASVLRLIAAAEALEWLRDYPPSMGADEFQEALAAIRKVSA